MNKKLTVRTLCKDETLNQRFRVLNDWQGDLGRTRTIEWDDVSPPSLRYSIWTHVSQVKWVLHFLWSWYLYRGCTMPSFVSTESTEPERPSTVKLKHECKSVRRLLKTSHNTMFDYTVKLKKRSPIF